MPTIKDKLKNLTAKFKKIQPLELKGVQRAEKTAEAIRKAIKADREQAG